MEFRDVVRRRRMVRNYDPDRPVPAEVRERILAHAIRAPSAGFSQGWGFLVLEEPADRERFWRAATPETLEWGRASEREERAPANPSREREERAPASPAVASKPSSVAKRRQAWLVSMRRAPLIIVAHSNKDIYLDRYAQPDKGWSDRDERRWPVPYWDIDTGFASLLMLLTAVDEGLGACFFGIPPEQMPAYRAEFGVPPEFTPIGAVSVGYPTPDHRSGALRRGRRPVDEVVHRGQWST